MREYWFLIQRDNGYDSSWASCDPQPVDALVRVVGDDLFPEPGTEGVWATEDKQTTVIRYEAKPVGSLPEDHGKVGDGVPAAVAR